MVQLKNVYNSAVRTPEDWCQNRTVFLFVFPDSSFGFLSFIGKTELNSVKVSNSLLQSLRSLNLAAIEFKFKNNIHSIINLYFHPSAWEAQYEFYTFTVTFSANELWRNRHLCVHWSMRAFAPYSNNDDSTEIRFDPHQLAAWPPWIYKLPSPAGILYGKYVHCWKRNVSISIIWTACTYEPSTHRWRYLPFWDEKLNVTGRTYI